MFTPPTQILADVSPALVWSVSYGEGVNGGNGGVIKPDYVQRLNVEMQKFGLRGLSVFVASGDSGVFDRLPYAWLVSPPLEWHMPCSVYGYGWSWSADSAIIWVVCPMVCVRGLCVDPVPMGESGKH